MAVRAASLCSGYGGLDLALRSAFGARTVVYVEREAYAAAVLAARMESGDLDQAPIWADLVTFDGKPWCGAVDLVCAGFPCQPHSVAGQRKGLADERWIWPEIARVIREMGPWLVCLENVPGLVGSGGLDACLGDLAALGFDAEWGCLRASAVGAPHERERVFILAHAANNGCARGESRGWQAVDGPEHACGHVADSDRSGIREQFRGGAWDERDRSGPACTNSDGHGRHR